MKSNLQTLFQSVAQQIHKSWIAEEQDATKRTLAHKPICLDGKNYKITIILEKI